MREVRSDVLESEDIGQELGEVVGVSGDLFDARGERCVPHVVGDELLLMTGRACARSRGDDDRIPLE